MSFDHKTLPTRERIAHMGYRAFVGGDDAEMWFGIGLLQFQFLVANGLRPNHIFIDIACGPLRLGQLLIPFLNEGNYFGLEAEEELVRLGLANELKFGLVKSKSPVFGFGYDFDFSFAKPFDYAIAQSLFTHLVPYDIKKCLVNLRTKAKPNSKFFFTFFEGDSAANPQSLSHANRNWKYSQDELHTFAEGTGWALNYIGDWHHPRKQKLVCAEPIF
ncbi:MAG: hypothetical protein R3192_17440 [Woeseiaceae bacterium]|nr:hypothetical protein [Woeseiaceae bacterium]